MGCFLVGCLTKRSWSDIMESVGKENNKKEKYE